MLQAGSTPVQVDGRQARCLAHRLWFMRLRRRYPFRVLSVEPEFERRPPLGCNRNGALSRGACRTSPRRLVRGAPEAGIDSQSRGAESCDEWTQLLSRGTGQRL